MASLPRTCTMVGSGMLSILPTMSFRGTTEKSRFNSWNFCDEYIVRIYRYIIGVIQQTKDK